MANYRRMIRNVGRKIYKATGYQNPMKKGKLMASRVIKQLPKVAKDVSILKSLVNAEKEIYSQNVTAATVGSLAGQQYLQPITNITEGTGHGQRDGESCKLHGFRWNVRFVQQTNKLNEGKAKCWLVKFIGPRGTTPGIDTFLKPDFDGRYTTNSERNEDWYTSYIVISSHTCYIKGDGITNQTSQALSKRYGRFLKDAHQRYSGAAATTLLTDQMYIIAVSDAGDSGAALTGLQFDSQLHISFYDN